MSQTMPPDREAGGPGGPVDDRRDPTTTPNKRESNFGDSSVPLFSMYSKAAEDEDKKMVENWKKDADGILIFTGLFSAAVAALLAVTVQDLRPNSQDTSAFYLGIIYQVLADPNITRSSTPSPVTTPPSFSPSRYAIWVNSLWFLSLVMSLSCAFWAISLQQWARRYLRRAQPSRCSPEKRARMRAFFAEGVEKMHISWAVEGLPMLLHISLFLFFGGLGVFLFNVDREVFSFVISWIGLFLVVYGFITLLPIIRRDSPYHSPLSTPAWFLYASIHYVTFKILSVITFHSCWSVRTWRRCDDLKDRYRGWMLGGVEKAAEETASERSSEIDVRILDWTISAHGNGDDDSLKGFLEAIPGFFNSKLVKVLERDFPEELVQKFIDALSGFLVRTWSSNSVDDSEKGRRFDISINATNLISENHDPFILPEILFRVRDEVPQTTEMAPTLARWCTNNDQHFPAARQVITVILVSVWERNDSWVTLAARVFGLPEGDLRDKIALGGDNTLLAILIHVTPQFFRYDYLNRLALDALSKLDIRNTLPRLQHDFCTLWNKTAQEAKTLSEGYTGLVLVLQRIRHLYIALHQGTDAVPTEFSAAIDEYSDILYNPLSYPICDLASHRPDSIPQIPLPTPPGDSSDALSPSPTDGGITTSRQAQQGNNVIEPPSSSNPMTTSEVGPTSHAPDMIPPTNPVHSGSRPTGPLLTVVVAAAPPDITTTATLSNPPEQSEQQDSDIVATIAVSGTSQILSTTSTHAPNNPLESYDVAPPFVRSSLPTSRPTNSATLPRLRARGLVNTGNMCFANAVLQLLVNLPPFWDLFRELGDLKGSGGTGLHETGGGTTPLVDATLRFFNEFIVEESPSMQQQSQPATSGASRADEEKKGDNVVDSLEPTYLYDAMKEKRQLKPLLDGRQQDAEEFLCLYLDALDEELSALLASISGRRSASVALEVEEREVSQSGQTVVGSHGFMTNLVESPITRIFGGKFRSPVRAPNQPDLVSTEDWRSLRLDIQHDSIRTAQDTLAHISHPPSVQVSASSLNNASQQVLIEALPPVLILHLNRVQYDAAAGGIKKIGKSIQLAPELEIPLDIMVPNAQRPSEPPHYKLYGVLYHHGESAGSGHYTVNIRIPDGEGNTGEVWLHIDNEAVSLMRHKDVFGEHGTEQAVDNRCAYLLFYCRASR